MTKAFVKLKAVWDFLHKPKLSMMDTFVATVVFKILGVI